MIFLPQYLYVDVVILVLNTSIIVIIAFHFIKEQDSVVIRSK